ncbi:MAG: nicotinate phosphoribosyltransferase [Balneolales bacterium]
MHKIPHPALYTDLYQLTMGQGYFINGTHQKKAHFDFFFRHAPFGGNFVVFAGLADLLPALESYRFTTSECDWLIQKGFNKEFCTFLKDFRFDGTIISVREGEVVFPEEPVLTVSGSLLSCQLIETLLLNILNFQSLIATKACRMRIACGKLKLVDFGLRRAQGTGGIAASRAAYIGGVDATSNVLAGFEYDIPVSGTMAHSWIQSFESELEAFRAYAKIYPDASILLVDTYNTLSSGIPNAITVAKELEQKGHRMVGVRLDSGDPAILAPKVRSMLDNAGLNYISIAVSDQLDEEKIASLLANNTPIDLFGVGTRLITGYPDGALSGVYKICELNGQPTMKFTDDNSKSNLPGVKVLLRKADEEGFFMSDRIALAQDYTNSGSSASVSGIAETEILLNTGTDSGSTVMGTGSESNTGLKEKSTESLRTCMMHSGQCQPYQTDLKKIAEFCRSRTNRVSEHIKRLSQPACYEINVSDSLNQLIKLLKI